MRIEVSYDHEGCFVHVYDDNGVKIGGSYEFVHKCESWEDCRDKAVEAAKADAEGRHSYGPPPPGETMILDDAGEVVETETTGGLTVVE